MSTIAQHCSAAQRTWPLSRRCLLIITVPCQVHRGCWLTCCCRSSRCCLPCCCCCCCCCWCWSWRHLAPDQLPRQGQGAHLVVPAQEQAIHCGSWLDTHARGTHRTASNYARPPEQLQYARSRPCTCTSLRAHCAGTRNSTLMADSRSAQLLPWLQRHGFWCTTSSHATPCASTCKTHLYTMLPSGSLCIGCLSM
jgi:hypothetical protein